MHSDVSLQIIRDVGFSAVSCLVWPWAIESFSFIGSTCGEIGANALQNLKEKAL
jgi:hypothetical protein